MRKTIKAADRAFHLLKTTRRMLMTKRELPKEKIKKMLSKTSLTRTNRKKI